MMRLLRWVPIVLGAAWAVNSLMGKNKKQRRRSWLGWSIRGRLNLGKGPFNVLTPILGKMTSKGLKQLVRR